MLPDKTQLKSQGQLSRILPHFCIFHKNCKWSQQGSLVANKYSTYAHKDKINIWKSHIKA